MSGRCEPIEKDRTDGMGPAAHELLIGGAIAKTLRVFGHFRSCRAAIERTTIKALCLHDISITDVRREASLPPNYLSDLFRPRRSWSAIPNSSTRLARLIVEPYRSIVTRKSSYVFWQLLSGVTAYPATGPKSIPWRPAFIARSCSAFGRDLKAFSASDIALGPRISLVEYLL